MLRHPIIARVLSRVVLGGLFATIALAQFIGAVHAGSWIVRNSEL